MIVNVQEARHIEGYRVWLRFNTGETGEADLGDLIHRYPVAAPLRDVENFRAFYLDAWPTLAWECGFDVAPETLYERAVCKSVVHPA